MALYKTKQKLTHRNKCFNSVWQLLVFKFLKQNTLQISIKLIFGLSHKLFSTLNFLFTL